MASAAGGRRWWLADGRVLVRRQREWRRRFARREKQLGLVGELLLLIRGRSRAQEAERWRLPGTWREESAIARYGAFSYV
jgi:hypothetical protein